MRKKSKQGLILTLMVTACLTSCAKKSAYEWQDTQGNVKTKKVASLWETQEGMEVQPLTVREEDMDLSYAETFVGETVLDDKNVQEPTGELARIFMPIFFATDQYAVTGQEHKEKLEQMAAYLREHKTLAIVISGHCDKRGSEAYNMSLGARRADAVKNYLVKKGIDPYRLHTVSCGKEMPFATGDDAESLALNRRSHFEIYHPPQK